MREPRILGAVVAGADEGTGAAPEIPFNRPFTTGRELAYVRDAIENGHLAGSGPFTDRCSRWLEQRIGSEQALLTQSCTGALEMAAMLLDIGPGDEVVMPSFTFVSTATSVVVRGGTPVFVDVRPDTLNIDEKRVRSAITPRTKAILVVHYAGVGCAMAELAAIAEETGTALVEDAAHGLLASYDGRPLGSFGSLAALSFHETKNVHCGEGGALLVNDPAYRERAEILLDKGTNRRRFFRGQVDKYTWVDVGGSYTPSEINAAFLWAQLEDADAITARRLEIWTTYHEAFADLEDQGLARRPVVPDGCAHNAHMYYLLLPDLESRSRLIGELGQVGIHAVFHYVPLHSSEGGRRYGRAAGDLTVSEQASERLVRLPLWPGMTDADVERVIDAVGVSSARIAATSSARAN
jgi:dTDP-4-amino-4,6-dideoxygalactose transaminase